MARKDSSDVQNSLRRLPSVDRILAGETASQWLAQYPRALVVEEIRAAVEARRRAIVRDDRTPAGATSTANGKPNPAGKPPSETKTDAEATIAAEIADQVTRRLEAGNRPSLRKVINATGVILHTNLGRAPLSAGALEAIRKTAGGYSNLEYDLETGRRGKRDIHASAALEKLLGAPAIVVNNNAAAIFLVLNELAAGGEVLVSRGELIEIGDGFRIPDILAKSGARLREVGTTNRTRIEDYRAAIAPETRAVLRVHPSNFRIVGFTARPALRELADLARDSGLPLVEDLGSGCLYDFAATGLEDEPPVTASLATGADLVTFSGDKLLGGPQAGVIAGREDLVTRVRRNPLFRALRADKLVYAALEATLRDYVLERYDEIPVLRMARESADEIRRRAERFVTMLGEDFPATVEIVPGQSVLGGGSTPGQGLPTWLVTIQPHKLAVGELEQRLRSGQPPVVARIEEDALRLDLRTVTGDQQEELRVALRSACKN